MEERHEEFFQSADAQLYVRDLSPQGVGQSCGHLRHGGRPGLISVAYGAGGTSRDDKLCIASGIQNRYDIRGLAHPTCVGGTKENIGQILDELRAHDVPHDQALAAALFAHMAQFVPVTLAGGLAMLRFPSGRAEEGQERESPLSDG